MIVIEHIILVYTNNALTDGTSRCTECDVSISTGVNSTLNPMHAVAM